MTPTINPPPYAAQPRPQSVRHLTKKDVAERLGVSTRTIEVWTKGGKMLLPVYPGGGRTPKWHSGQFEEWFDLEHRSKTEPATSEVSAAQAGHTVELPEATASLSTSAGPTPAPATPRLEPSGPMTRFQAQSNKKLERLLGN